MGWCETGHHSLCRREYDIFFIDPKGKIVYTGAKRVCECPKRSCKCYVKVAERTKKKTRKRKSK